MAGKRIAERSVLFLICSEASLTRQFHVTNTSYRRFFERDLGWILRRLPPIARAELPGQRLVSRQPKAPPSRRAIFKPATRVRIRSAATILARLQP